MENSVRRIEWCDVYKGIVILLMVIGHYTGKYNFFIYSFHMAAFFFISGYTCNFKRNTTLEFTVKKGISLMIPYVFFVMSATGLFWVLKRLKVLSYISTTVFPENYQDAFFSVFSTGTVWCDWLGAMWFVPVLFGSSVIAKVLKNHFSSLGTLFVSVMIFLAGQGVSKEGGSPFSIDLMMIAQYYVVLGSFVKERGLLEVKEQNRKGKYISGVVCAIIFAFIAILIFHFNLLWITDWPTRRFNGPIDLLSPILGIGACVLCAMFFVKIKCIKNIFIVMGKNTFAIMIFHFLGFKLFYGLLVLVGKEDYTILSLLTPTDSIRQTVWFGVPVAISIVFSICIWSLMMKSRIIRICCGKEKGLEYYIFNDRVFESIQEVYVRTSALMKELLVAFKRKRITLIAALTVCVFMAGVRFFTYIGPFEVCFPTQIKQIEFEEGWYAQSEGESYRWIDKESNISVYLVDQRNLYIKGYIPANVKNMSQMLVYVNDIVICEEEVSADCLIEISEDISNYKIVGLNDICIVFDGCRVPEENDEDMRQFSAMIELIEFR